MKNYLIYWSRLCNSFSEKARDRLAKRERKSDCLHTACNVDTMCCWVYSEVWKRLCFHDDCQKLFSRESLYLGIRGTTIAFLVPLFIRRIVSLVWAESPALLWVITFSRQSTTSASRQSYTTSFGGLCKVPHPLVVDPLTTTKAVFERRFSFEISTSVERIWYERLSKDDPMTRTLSSFQHDVFSRPGHAHRQPRAGRTDRPWGYQQVVLQDRHHRWHDDTDTLES